MNVHVVDSRKTQLNPRDILLVAAFEDKDAIKMFTKPAEKLGMTPERLAFSVNMKFYSDPKLMRVRAGNTLFTIATVYPRVGYVKGYNGDTAPNYINNIVEFFDSARKMGYDQIITHLSNDALRALKTAIHRSKLDLKLSYDPKQNLAAIRTGPERD